MRIDFIMDIIARQYTTDPSYVPEAPIENQPIRNEPEPQQPKKSKKLVYAVIVLVLLAAIVFAFFYFSGNKTTDEGSALPEPGNGDTEVPADENVSGNGAAAELSGNGKCDPPDENCFDAPKECPCAVDEYCSTGSKVCTKPECGNGKCETGEYSDNCCDDCGCNSPACESCNKETHSCQIPEANLSDDAAVAAINRHYSDAGQSVANVTVRGSACTNSKPSRSAVVNLAGVEFPRMVRVTESGEVIELLTN